jgi:hypothetical protein
VKTSKQRRAITLGAVGSIVGTGVGLVPATSHADVPTMSSGTLRNGWDSTETGLTPGDVTSSDFGQLFATQLTNADGTPDYGHIFAEPTVVDGTLIVANENNNVYGLDPHTGAVKWRRSAGPAWPGSTIGCNDLTPTVGITSTPVYDPATNALYFTDKTPDPDNAHPNWYMHAVDPASGAEKPGFPVKIGGSPSNDPSNTFNAEYQMQRPGLLLLDGVVYAGFGDHCALNPPAPAPGYRGYVVGVDTRTATQSTMWTDSMATTDGVGAGIWASGGGLMSDGDGTIILTTGNGDAPGFGPGHQPPSTLGDSVVRLHVNPDKTLSPVDFFSPANSDVLGRTDGDLGSGSPTGLPDGFFGSGSTVQRTLVQQGKDGRLFLLNRDNLGGRTQDDSGALQVLNLPTRQWGREAVYGGEGGYVYDIGLGSQLRALKAGVDSSGKPQLTQVGTSANTFGYYAVSPVVTSDGTTPGSAVVWAVDPTAEGTNGGPAQLTAYNAIPDAHGNLAKLFSASVGSATKFATPVSDGNRMYVGNNTGVIYGFGRRNPLIPGQAVVTRESGSDRYGTGVAVSQSMWADAGGDTSGRKRAQAVVLARGDAFPDALAGVPLAAKAQGPLLLTEPKTLPEQTLNEIRRVLPGGGTIYVLGGTSAVSNDVALKLSRLGYRITRYGGTDRYATSLQIAQQGLGNPGNVMLATGLDFADALAAGPFAAGAASSNGTPAAILLTDGKQMDPATAAYVAARAKNSTAAAPRVWAVGGPAVTAAKSLHGYVKTFSGADRYATDAQLVQAQKGVPFVGVAVGTNFADALTGGAAAAVERGALITVPSTLPATTAQLLSALAPAVQAVDVFGGTAVIANATVNAITKAVGGHPA